MLNRIKNLFGTTFKKGTFRTARASDEFLLRETDFGTVHVETDIIRRIVEKTHIEGVHEINNVIIDAPNFNNPLQIKLNLIILQNYSAPMLGAKLRDAIKEELKNLLDIRDALFDIRVTQINPNLPEQKKRRVR